MADLSGSSSEFVPWKPQRVVKIRFIEFIILLIFFLFFWVTFAHLDPDPDPDCESGSGSRDPCESGSNPDPDPKHSFKNNKSVRSHKTVEIMFFLTFCLLMEGSGANNYGSGSGSGRPKNVWILRLQIPNRNTDDNGTTMFSYPDISCIVSVFLFNVL